MANDIKAKLASRSFVVIDDEAFMRNLLVRLLQRLGAANVATKVNGKEALSYLQSTDSPADVLLIDLNMPEMGGVELLRHLADNRFGGAVILVSGADHETLAVAEGMAKYREVNVLGYVTKPVDPDSLLKLLERLA